MTIFFHNEFKNLKIVGRGKNTQEQRIVESIFINKYREVSINIKADMLNIYKIHQSIL